MTVLRKLLGSAATILCLSAHAFAAQPQTPNVLLPVEGESVILFLLDNSASLPPLDPNTQRREAIEKIYTFLQGQPYRLILFGGRKEIFVDQPQHYRNGGKWTDFYFAFEAAKEVADSYPAGTEFKIVLITDGILDPGPSEWRDQQIPAGADLKQEVGDRTIRLLNSLGLPLYVILIGEEVDYELIERMVVGANGAIAASDYAQGIAEFFEDDGVLLRRFIFRVEEDEGLEVIEPIVTRIATPPAPRVEFAVAGFLLVFIGVLIGVGVRSFPGSGDREILEMSVGHPLQVAVDRRRKGLSLEESSRHAVCMLTLKEQSTEIPPHGLPLDNIDPTARSLIELPLEELSERMQHLAKEGDKDEQIYVLNLQYVANDMEEAFVERLIKSAPEERAKFGPLDFLRAKVHLLDSEKMMKKLAGPSVDCKIYGLDSSHHELRPGSKIQLGRYAFRVDELSKGGRKDYKLILSYESVPSPLFLKKVVPGAIQRLLRMRRTHERIVSQR